jgi:hypothetical protein
MFHFRTCVLAALLLDAETGAGRTAGPCSVSRFHGLAILGASIASSVSEN